MNHHQYVDIYQLAAELPYSRCADVALGVLLARRIIAELPGLPRDECSLIRLALCDVATAVDPDAQSRFTDLLARRRIVDVDDQREPAADPVPAAAAGVA